MFFNNSKKKKERSEPTYWERVIKGKGTVAEDWPTAEELWNNVKEEAKEVQSILNDPKKKIRLTYAKFRKCPLGDPRVPFYLFV